MALVADNFAISVYGEDEMTFHLLAIAHIVSFFFDSSYTFQVEGKIKWEACYVMNLDQ